MKKKISAGKVSTYKVFKMQIAKFLILIFSITALSSCANKVIDIKSPCVSNSHGLSDGPCGPKKPINDWWLKDYKKYNS